MSVEMAARMEAMEKEDGGGRVAAVGFLVEGRMVIGEGVTRVGRVVVVVEEGVLLFLVFGRWWWGFVFVAGGG